MNKTIGTCSICGGAVTVPEFWGGIIPPTPTCSSCGAVPSRAKSAVIQMVPKPDMAFITTLGAKPYKLNAGSGHEPTR